MGEGTKPIVHGCLVVMRKLYVRGDVTMCYGMYRPRTFFLESNVHLTMRPHTLNLSFLNLQHVVAEAYTTQPNSKASSRVLYIYLACMGRDDRWNKGMHTDEQHMWAPHACAVMPWGG